MLGCFPSDCEAPIQSSREDSSVLNSLLRDARPLTETRCLGIKSLTFWSQGGLSAASVLMDQLILSCRSSLYNELNRNPQKAMARRTELLFLFLFVHHRAATQTQRKERGEERWSFQLVFLKGRPLGLSV